MRACLDARRLISRRPTRSPLLKLPLPCLNSHRGESGEPVWKTSLTAAQNVSVLLAPPRETETRVCWPHTFMESVHVQLSDEGRNIGMLKI